MENYRPIANLAPIPKLFELLIYDVIYSQCANLIIPNQHGFLKGKSTLTNLIETTSSLTESMEAGSQTDVIYTDLSKAFDILPHEIILFKLEKLKFPLYFINWVRTYLKDRVYSAIITLERSASPSAL